MKRIFPDSLWQTAVISISGLCGPNVRSLQFSRHVAPYIRHFPSHFSDSKLLVTPVVRTNTALYCWIHPVANLGQIHLKNFKWMPQAMKPVGLHISIFPFTYCLIYVQPCGLVVRVSDYQSWGPGFDSRFYDWNFSLQGKIPVVTIVPIVSRFRLKAPPDISSSCISPLTSSGQRSRASWASQPQKSATLSPQPGGKPRKFIRTCGGIWGRGES